MAMSLDGEGELLDPFDGRGDLGRSMLRVLHERSIADDPTRAIRAARYASRFHLDPDRGTAAAAPASSRRCSAGAAPPSSRDSPRR